MPFWKPSARTLVRRNHEKNNNKPSRGRILKSIVGIVLFMSIVWNYVGFQYYAQNQRDTDICKLRKYPPHRYYKLNNKEQPSFLTTETEYIYGEWPIVLRDTKTTTTTFKLAVDQTAWREPSHELPFADGTNPSILSMDRLLLLNERALILQHYPNTRFLATACMTNSQCAWKDSPLEIKEYRISKQQKPDTIRTVLLLLDASFHTIAQTTIVLERDAAWGRKLRQPAPNQWHIPALDDARLFQHNHSLFVSYREGPGFGYDTQVLNPIHIDFSGEWTARIRASETSSFCCGRNMALMKGSDDAHLRALTWVDPVTVIDVDTTPGATNKSSRRQLAKQQQHKSHIHGTNGFMVEIIPSSTTETTTFLGVAHFHRPNDRNENPYARFGHHYTHAFYTIRNDRLVGLSPEFVLPSKYDKDDAEIIQFLSGLEYDAKRNQVVIAYGINDCEAAIAVFDLQVIQRFLRPVEEGKQVVDFMMPLK